MTDPATARSRGQRKPLEPVQVRVEHLAYNHALGIGTVDIVSEETAQTYLLFANRNEGQLLGMRLVKVSSGEQHDIDMTTSPWRCDCGDATHRPNRPGGCRHVVALRQAAEQVRKEPD